MLFCKEKIVFFRCIYQKIFKNNEIFDSIIFNLDQSLFTSLYHITLKTYHYFFVSKINISGPLYKENKKKKRTRLRISINDKERLYCIFN